MKVLMFGWEFPPYSSGGLGTACYGLTKGLSSQGVDVTFVVPHLPDSAKAEFVNLVSASNVKIKKIKSLLTPYMTSNSYMEFVNKRNKKSGVPNIYGSSLFSEVERFTRAAANIAKEEGFDVIHCHDWMTYRAGIKAKKMSKKPLVVHVHATEFDRTGGNGVCQYVYDIEKQGLYAADAVITVSNYTKNMVIRHYGVNPDKVHVAHNAVEFTGNRFDDNSFKIKQNNKIVLFLGRITLQKGPDYFIYAAKRVLDIEPDIRFIVVGNGDMEPYMIEKAAELGIADKVLFAGFLKGKDIDKAYQMADLYVMPSVSEPFGITPLEAMRNGTPVIISKQSGVSEVIKHCFKVDFWDIDQMANQIIACLKYKELHEELKENAMREVLTFNWRTPAEKCIEVYNKVSAV